MNKGVQKSGVGKVRKDSRDFSHAKKFGSLMLTVLPPGGLGRKPVSIKDQGGTTECTGMASATVGEYRVGVPCSPDWQYSKNKQEEGNISPTGSDPRATLSAAVEFGFLPQTLAPFTWQDKGEDFIANYNNWPKDLDEKAKANRKSSYFKVDGQFDVFDNIRTVLWQGKDDKEAVLAFGHWYSEWNNPINGIVTMPHNEPLLLHAYTFIDWKQINGVDYLVAQLSQGKDFGDRGLLYFSREVVNFAWGNVFKDGTGLYTFRDFDPEQIKREQYNIWNLILHAYETLVQNISDMIKKKL